MATELFWTEQKIDVREYLSGPLTDNELHERFAYRMVSATVHLMMAQSVGKVEIKRGERFVYLRWTLPVDTDRDALEIRLAELEAAKREGRAEAAEILERRAQFYDKCEWTDRSYTFALANELRDQAKAITSPRAQPKETNHGIEEHKAPSDEDRKA